MSIRPPFTDDRGSLVIAHMHTSIPYMFVGGQLASVSTNRFGNSNVHHPIFYTSNQVPLKDYYCNHIRFWLTFLHFQRWLLLLCFGYFGCFVVVVVAFFAFNKHALKNMVTWLTQTLQSFFSYSFPFQN